MGTVILFILVLSVLVLAHEWGHFFVARKSGMKVHEFGIGFPPRAFGIYKDPKTKKWVFVKGKGKSSLSETVGGEDRKNPDEFPATLYSFNWLPLGGFVKIKGENGEEAHDTDSFMFQKAWKKVLVLVAGVTMNFLLAAVLLGIGLGIGLPTDVSQGVDEGAIFVQEPAVLVQQVVPDSPAQHAGLEVGDKILSVNGQPLLQSSDAVQAIRDNKDAEMILSIERGAELLDVPVTAAILENGEVYQLGVLLADAAIIRYPWHIALLKGFGAAAISLINIFIAFFYLIKGLITGQGLAFDVAGPVGIANIIGQSARLGIEYLINVTAMISLSLAAINILPIPALDGGRLLFVLIERGTGRPVPMKYEQAAHTIGFMALLALIAVVTFRDIVGLM
ncbi:MAG: RIP metalloprotease RseP [Candidatus Magasanikbacteria bacterium CG10_big_fil_rev_8_21_14_0_10_47_10]|uniref:Zinc metalloprotease n=1 Tax=Candidatus Magasanikbacteria bacterium CG10_big_fil_rev_8_21_14_0_10_47_10 TaxID=1974652 RepID=A0A2H0TQJ0_9BACT|nr:MAG: RIP metalloprotease RseP [Candidatus Magasanikbacteria bacterium CG10_big_fil_rev_8_21_14_0_10_47_10]